MKVIAERNWSWMLFEDDGTFILSVVCGSVGICTREIQLSIQELEEYRALGEKVLDRLAEDISYTQSKYESRQIPNFHLNKEATLAAEIWRSAHAKRP